MEARERLAEILRQRIKADAVGLAPAVIGHLLIGFEDAADAILAALHLTDAAALALMDGEGAVVPKDLTDDVRYVSWFVQYKSRGGSDGDADLLSRQRVADPDQVAIDHASYDAVLAASPYKENPDDPR